MGKVICAWCGEFIREDPEIKGGDSHGICKKCAEKEREKLKEEKKRKEKRIPPDGDQ